MFISSLPGSVNGYKAATTVVTSARTNDTSPTRRRSDARSFKFAVAAAIAAAAALVAVLPAASSAHRPGHGHGGRDRHGAIRHVLLISVDGLHQSDLDWYVANHPGSELAKLADGGAEYTNAHTSDPSDSDPGGTALMTGGDPRATGVYYDVEYNHNLYEAGTTSCHGPTGAESSTTRPTTST